MPMFPTPKPRQFHYQPRFYDPEKERWEALKQKYADERMLREMAAEEITTEGVANEVATTTDADLEYFERRVRELESEDRKEKRGLTWRDMFRKREMPKFNYQPRFATSEAVASEESAGEKIKEYKRRATKIKRRFDVSDPDYLKPVPASRIMLYTLLVCLLLYWIIF